MKCEILAPAGNKETFIGAINAGANAIYLAGKKFGARAYAPNFENEELIEMIKYAHLRNVRIYVVVNTLIYDDEIPSFLEYTDFLVENCVDALITQDLGMIDILIKRYPNTDIHASTQTNIHNVEQVKFLKELGVKRIILARETSLDMIKKIKSEVDIELEVFVHGALCVAYSGNCLFSSLIGNRSGNRGECAQPCRLQYSLFENDKKTINNEYLLSTKDLLTINEINELIDAGIDSFKIEGRMRKKEYVIQTVLSYKQAILEKTKNNFKEIINLKKVFNREFTKGYMFLSDSKDINNKFRPNHIGINIGKVIAVNKNTVDIKLEEDISLNDGIRFLSSSDYGMSVSRILKKNTFVTDAYKNDIITLDVGEKIDNGSMVVKTSDSKLELKLQDYLADNYKLIPLECEIFVFNNKPLSIIVKDGLGNKINSNFFTVEKAKTSATSDLVIKEQLSKTGNTPFYFTNIKVTTDNESFLSVKDINEIRRQVLSDITDIRIKRKKDSIINDPTNNESHFIEEKNELIVKVKTSEQLLKVYELGVKAIYYPLNLNIDLNNFTNVSLIPYDNRIKETSFNDNKVRLINDLGSINGSFITDEFFNVINIYTVNFLNRFGAKRVCLSHELTFDRIKNLVKNYNDRFHQFPNLELIIYGRQELMITKYKLIEDTDSKYFLQDRKNELYPLKIEDENMIIYNYSPLNLIKEIDKLKKFKSISLRINLTNETNVEIENIFLEINEHKKIDQKYNTGYFLRY